MLDCESCFHLFVAIAARFSYDTGMFASHVNGMFCLSARAGMSLINLNYPSFRFFFRSFSHFHFFQQCHQRFTLGTRGFFSRAAWSIFGWRPNHERRSREKNLWSGALRFTVPVELWSFFIGFNLSQSDPISPTRVSSEEMSITRVSSGGIFLHGDHGSENDSSEKSYKFEIFALLSPLWSQCCGEWWLLQPVLR